MIKIGQGIDVHAFHNTGEQQQYVILAGVPIEHTHSLLAHSDGDVVLHALADALLGALALGILGNISQIPMPRTPVWIRASYSVMCMVKSKLPVIL